jgi:2-oxo-4-hydroxy-4-carboxy-5-ureidoimidazoline decarboxylase
MISLSQLNSFSREEFVRVIGPVFEHSPWIAEVTWHKRPFASIDALHEALGETVAKAGEMKQVQLIQAHPDLVGRAALAGTLTPESNQEQASAGLGQLSPDEIALFQKNNRAYREKFGFPFVICARLNKKEAILKGFEIRLKNSREQEIKAALEEIGKIAGLRLADLTGAGK